MNLSNTRALCFDIFGTVVDPRTNIVHEARELGAAKGLNINWDEFVNAWDALYLPMIEQISMVDQAPWISMDVLLRRNLIQVLQAFNITQFTEAEITHLNQSWHRLDPWPDCVPGITRLKQKYILATLSNGSMAQMISIAKRAGLPWDVILGAEPTRAYKPHPEAYLRTATMLGLMPEQCMLVACHPSDLRAARAQGYQTAYIARSFESGSHKHHEIITEKDFDFVTDSMENLADLLGC